MDDLREKVISSLETLKQDFPKIISWQYDDQLQNTVGNIELAITLLKAQEPRVMTLEEVKALPYDADIWIETEYYVGKITIFAATINTKGLRGVMVYGSHKTYDYEAYNKLWRCWTSRPTDAQREAVKWND